MTNPTGATRARLGHLLLCIVALVGLAACGGDGPAGNATSNGSLVSPRIGMIDRQPTRSPGLQAPTTTTPPPTATADPPTAPKQNPGIPPVKADGSATLDWTPPTQNSDGTTLANLAGYTVYYGTSPDELTRSVKLTNPGLTAYTVSNLSSGTWYFAVSAYSSSGIESVRTDVISTTI